ncbi:hypothetical protein [Caudoviricetes sp.]|nr:hypothetical protein [Caudoviricetes sp.]
MARSFSAEATRATTQTRQGDTETRLARSAAQARSRDARAGEP